MKQAKLNNPVWLMRITKVCCALHNEWTVQRILNHWLTKRGRKTNVEYLITHSNLFSDLIKNSWAMVLNTTCGRMLWKTVSSSLQTIGLASQSLSAL